jgi:hypothetical protein
MKNWSKKVHSFTPKCYIQENVTAPTGMATRME